MSSTGRSTTDNAEYNFVLNVQLQVAEQISVLAINRNFCNRKIISRKLFPSMLIGLPGV